MANPQADNRGHGLIDVSEEDGGIRVLTTYGSYLLVPEGGISANSLKALIDDIKKGRFIRS